MPIFEYTCPKCGERFEKLVLSRNQAPPPCPKCGARHVERMLSVFATAGASQKSPAAVCAPAGGG